MTESEMKRVETYLRRLFGTQSIRLAPPAQRKGSVELVVGKETIGTIYKDVEDGETSYSAHLTILEEDLA